MKYAIVYSSRTGNTEQLAKRLQEKLPQEDCIYLGEPCSQALSASIIFVGFWTDKGSCDESTKAFLKALSNKKVFLFGTAGFGENAIYYQKILDNVTLSLDKSVEIIGSFMCQGKMPDTVLQRYEKMLTDTDKPVRIKEMIDNFHKAASHPNKADFTALQQTATSLFC